MENKAFSISKYSRFIISQGMWQKVLVGVFRVWLQIINRVIFLFKSIFKNRKAYFPHQKKRKKEEGSYKNFVFPS